MVGVVPAAGWSDLTRRSFQTVCRLAARLHHNPRPLRTIKDAAYAWRQMLFYMSMTSPEDQAALASWARETARGQPEHVVARLGPALAGLARVTTGGSFDADGLAGDGRRFLGWTVDGHWMRPPQSRRGAGAKT